MNADEMRKRVRALLDAFNSAGIPVALDIVCQALAHLTPKVKAEDLRTLMQDTKTAEKSKKKTSCKAYYIQQQRGKQARWKR